MVHTDCIQTPAGSLKSSVMATQIVHVSYKDAAFEACDDFERLCAEHIRLCIRSVERKCSEMRATIGEAEKAGVDRVNSHLERLKREVLEMRRREDKLSQLSQTEDPIQFFQVKTCLESLGCVYSLCLILC